MRRRWIDVGCLLLLLAATFLLYRKATRLFWTYDDAYLIHIASSYVAADHFVGTSIWRSMPQQLFTPLLTASYDAQLSLFDLQASRYYAVHLLLLALLPLCLYALLRLWLPPAVSFAAALLFLAGTPLCSLATQLMLVHYTESLILALVSAMLYTVALRRDSLGVSVGSALVYFAAMLAKEIAVPLPVALLLIPDRPLRTKVRALIPHAIALGAYTLLRFRALETLFGGYGWAVTASDVPTLLAATPLRLLRVVAGPHLLLGAALLATLAVAMVFLIRRRWGLAAVAVAVLLSVLPILPMAKEMQKRFALGPWLAASVLFAVGCHTARTREAARALLIAAPLLALAVNRQEWRVEYGRALRMSDEARAFFELGPGDYLRKPLIPAGSMGELKWLKEERARRSAGAGWFYDDLFLCSGNPPRRIVEYLPGRRTVAEVTGSALAEARRFCGSIRKNASLSADFQYRDGALFWQFGPYAEGKYAVVMGDGTQAYEVPRRDGFRLRGIPALPVRVRYEAPQGWVTYSPEMTIPLQEGASRRWRR